MSWKIVVRVGALMGIVGLVLLGRESISADPKTRTPWTTSKVIGSAEPPPPFKVVEPFPKLKFDHPLLIARAPGLPRLFIGEQAGVISSIQLEPGAMKQPFLDLPKELKTLDRLPTAGSVESVYGLAFHPKFAENRYCYVCYTLRSKKKDESNLPEGTRVSRFRVVGDDPPRADPASEEIILTYLQGGHNGGDLHFGPDGYLYISTGDAANPKPPDPRKTGQDITDLLSSVLRIDVDHKDPGLNYAIPKDNPFIGLSIGDKKARPEVWAYGFRNPWRKSFDRSTGDLWLGDVGWELWEMVHKIEKGGNYGWSVVEARQPIHPNDPPGPTPIRPPTIEISHTDGASVTGGYVYRGKKFPELVGKYIFGDWETRRIWAATTPANQEPTLQELVKPSVRVVAFGEDNAGEIYFLDYDRGTLHTFERNDRATTATGAFPKTLSQTGIFQSTKDLTPAEGVYPYQIRAQQWQDYATSDYLIALPGKSSVAILDEKKPVPGSVDWHSFGSHFPANAVLVKTLYLDNVVGQPKGRHRIETQLLHFDGEDWRGYSYAWRTDQSDADLVASEGDEKIVAVADKRITGGVRHQVWTYASRSQCLQCHNAWSEYALTITPEQLNRGSQLLDLQALGLIEHRGKNQKPEPYTQESLARVPQYAATVDDESEPQDKRARTYLQVNCAHCHRFGGGGSVNFELLDSVDLAKQPLFDAPAQRGTFNIPNGKLIVKGHPAQSVLVYRMAKFGSGRMPHIGSDWVDHKGVRLISDWIARMDDSRLVGVPGPPADLAALRSLSSHPNEAIELARAFHGGYWDDAAWAHAKDLLASLPASEASNHPFHDLFSGYLPYNPAKSRLGSRPRPRAILSLQGDATRGKDLFFAKQGQCIRCHKLEGQGTEIGPDLAKIGSKLTKPALLESLLEPSRRIEPRYQAHVVKLHDGRIVTGLIVSRTEKELVVKEADGKDRRLLSDDIEKIIPQRESLMPSGLLAEFTPQQAADLVQYLSERK